MARQACMSHVYKCVLYIHTCTYINTRFAILHPLYVPKERGKKKYCTKERRICRPAVNYMSAKHHHLSKYFLNYKLQSTDTYHTMIYPSLQKKEPHTRYKLNCDHIPKLIVNAVNSPFDGWMYFLYVLYIQYSSQHVHI